jgi:hypothetical protein
MGRTATTAEQRIFDLFAEMTLEEMETVIYSLEAFRRFVEKRDAKINGQPKPKDAEKPKEAGAPA